MKPTARRILTLWKQDTSWQATLTEVREALGATKAQSGRVRELLAELVEQGALGLSRHRYHLPRPARATPPVPRSAEAAPEAAGSIGILSSHPNGFGFVDLEDRRKSVFIPPPYIGGALDGDWVRVEHVRPRGRARPYGKVVEVVRRKRTHVRGRLHVEPGQTWLTPLNERLPMVFLAEGPPPEGLVDGALVEAELTHYPTHPDEAPEGRLLQVLPAGEEPEQVVLHILADTGLSAAFSPATHAEMGRLERTVRVPRGSRREDLRGRTFVTIDGKDARDFDDAVCLEPIDGGNCRLLVAIADVAEYVRPDTAVEQDAYAKGTSVYFPRQVFPMLPEALSNELCSLKPRVPRLALVCEMELTEDGERVDYRLYEAVIESKARLTYTQVQQFFDSGRHAALAAPVADMLGRMRTLAARMRARRSRRGALDFTFPEYRFELDGGGYPQQILAVYPTEATRLIEQFMVEANETVAWHCEQEGISILYRVHEPPPPDLVAPLVITLWNFGLEAKAGELQQPLGVKRLLDQLKANPNREQAELAILKSMSQAVYREHNDGHFALAASHYTHFTSPIRRFPDLLLHRALKAAWAGKHRQAALPPHVGLHLSSCERTAAEAEQRVIRLYKVLYMEPHLGQTFSGTVTGVGERGLFLSLREHPVEGLLPLTALPGKGYKVDRERNLLHARGQKTVGLGARVSVVLARADRFTQQLEFAFVDWGWPEPEPETAEAAPGRRRQAGRRHR